MPTLPLTAAGQIILAGILAVAAFYLLLPKPRSRSVAGGIAAGIAALAVFALWTTQAFAKPTQDSVAIVLFVLFSAGALIFGTVLVTQRNPARGAIAFAFVILSTCGLFLLLAAPFLMAATVIIYAGAIIVTFLFVLMLSHADGPSDENDRTREPLLGSFAGFAFTGLVLFCLYKNAPPPLAHEQATHELPFLVLTDADRAKLQTAAARLDVAATEIKALNPTELAAIEKWFEEYKATAHETEDATRFYKKLRASRTDQQAASTLKLSKMVFDLSKATTKKFQVVIDSQKPFDTTAAAADIIAVRDSVRLLNGARELPARNVSNLGFVLYTDHLLAVELAGTLLLVATIGAVAIAGRKGAPA